jgi:hypothetical protein
VLPSDLDYGAPRVKAFDPDRAAEAQQDAIDLLDEAQEMALVRSASYQQTLCRNHERKIRGRTLKVGHLVLRRAQSTKDKHKLTPPWEGLYMIAEAVQPGTYRLNDSDGSILTNAWIIDSYIASSLKFSPFVCFCPHDNSYSAPGSAP